jgi:hypothetical protein
MAAADPTEAALLTVLRLAGLTLALDADREAVITGNRNALTVWHALATAIERLDTLVIAALDAEAVEAVEVAGVGVGETAETEPEAAAGVAVPEVPAAPEVPEVVAKPHKPPPGPRTDSGIPYLDGVALAWRARRDMARQHGIPFTEAPPYSWEDT